MTANTRQSSSFAILNPVKICLIALLFAATTMVAKAQKADPNDPKNAERGVELVKQSIEARGGARYLNFKTLTALGQFTPFDKGISQIPMQFLDVIVFPDKERVEFGKGKKKDRRIQVNVGSTGWIYDGDAETLKDQTDKQIQAHLDGLEFDIDRILRAGWKEPGVEVRFVGREEIRPGERADVVEFQLKTDRRAYLMLDRNTHLPMSLIFEKSEDGGLARHEVRFFQYISYDGVIFPNIVDFYRNGVQESRVNYQSVKLDLPISEDLFAKPVSAKAIK
ncbi:MAG: hypothetical protein L0226_06765 [Acidobacteria bacterium]|nr:hypothetical protein [Acidobacteriota bacterium]